ncbi:jg25640 [Pararge aegeria aegeria]|uniref:Jg25640 protein n=1 Tax=Pararge aegeria aegeria TaxID=348720 RepID=A0A8S4QXN1_9NEOP|nr:jg25640 [Pararge aegeria aegeria]
MRGLPALYREYAQDVVDPEHVVEVRKDLVARQQHLGPVAVASRDADPEDHLRGMICRQEVEAAINLQNKEKFTNNNVVPEFDPKSKNQTIDTWLNKVKECSEIYGWDSKQTTHYALPKLVGTAKKWYEGQPSVLHTWDEWAQKLKSAFPSYENYGHLLTEMLAKRAKFGEDLEEYFYEKLIALNRCGIVGRNAIDCIVYGIDDRSVRYGAEAVGFEDVDKLLGYLRGVKHERSDKKSSRPVAETLRKSVKNDLGRVIKCFNCHETGHVISGCKKNYRKVPKMQTYWARRS